MQNRLATYVEQQILTASPLGLIVLSYRFAIDAIAEARKQLQRGALADYSRSIARAQSILIHLNRSLDHSAGDGKLAQDLSRLYRYIVKLVFDANQIRTEAKLTEAIDLLTRLLESWESLANDETRVRALPRGGSWTQEENETTDGHYSVVI